MSLVYKCPIVVVKQQLVLFFTQIMTQGDRLLINEDLFSFSTVLYFDMCIT